MDRPPVRMNWTWLNDLLPESAVSTALIDIVQPGQVCFDVGAHHAHLSVVMSRLTGPRGLVCAFEANRATARHAVSVLRDYGCQNVWVSHGAVTDRTGQVLPLYGDGHGGDSIVFERAGRVVDEPRTMSLDDFCRTNDVWPDVMKLDIEGAELPALHGAPALLERTPLVVTEMSSSDLSVVEHLQKRGYDRFIDLNNYHHIGTASDFFDEGVGAIRNVLCVPAGTLAGHPIYGSPAGRARVFESRSEDWARQRRTVRTVEVRLAPGRYVAWARPAAGPGGAVHYRVISEGEPLVGYTGPAGMIATHYPDLPFQLYEPSRVCLEFSPAARRLPRRFSAGDARIEKLEGNEDLQRPLLL